MPMLLMALFVIATVGSFNAASFEVRAALLQRDWQAAQAAGVPAAGLSEARQELDAMRVQRAGPVPYSVLSGAAVSDPFQRPEASASAAYRVAMQAARGRAESALTQLRAASGPNDDLAYFDRLLQLYGARRPSDVDAMAARWTRQAGAMAALRDRLAGDSGGLASGLPADIVAAVTHLTDLEARAADAGIPVTATGAAIAGAQRYLALPYPKLMAGHTAALADLRAATDALQRRLDLRTKADELLAGLPDLIGTASQYGAGDDFASRADSVRASIKAARAAGDEAALEAALLDLQKLSDDLKAAAGGHLPLAGLPCRTDAPAQLIVIHLATQQLVAYKDGCPFLRTPVTSGRTALPTVRGTFHIYYKAPVYHMISPWPLGSPFYYPPTWVYNAMEFITNGTFIHSADWQPDATYGPGSQYGPFASHGCIHVIKGPLQELYDWAPIGTTVVVGD
jgi:hypothetical protein